MSTATSSSDRYRSARVAIEEINRVAKAPSMHPTWVIRQTLNWAADALRALIEPSATNETPEQIATAIYDQHAHTLWAVQETARTSLLEAVHAGIQAAWESWEPDDYAEQHSE